MRVEDLERELRAERPEPELEFTRRLDEWAEAGFPRDRGLGPGVGRASGWGALRRAWERISSTPPRRIMIPVGAVATAVVVGAVAITQGGKISGDDGQTVSPSVASTTTSAASAGDASAGAGSAAGAAEQSQAPRSVTEAPKPELRDLAPTVPGASTEDSVTSSPAPGSGGGGGIARGTEARITDATATITLGADADQVQDVANQVVGVADRYDGIVESSQVSTDQAGARASLQLQIPFKQLEAALADLSDLADVVSRSEGQKDITARAVRARKQLADQLDQIRRARIELIQADTREQRLVIKARIASLQASADAAQTQLNGVKRQGRFASVDVEVTSDGGASTSSDDSGWRIGDALDDAGRVLEVIAGIGLVSLAVLLPLALIVALAAFAVSRGRRRGRERALDLETQSS